MKTTLRALLSSGLALVICVSMLIGTTFAWFTDSATSANNKIQAGTLDIELYEWTDENTSSSLNETSDPVFGDDILWEPGMTQTVYFSIKNAGTLDLKYRVTLDVKIDNPNTNYPLTDVMSYVISHDAKYGDLQAWPGNGERVVEGYNATEATAVPLYASINSNKGPSEHFFALSIHMDEEAGNGYMGESITFDIKLDAAQLTSEVDGFGNSDYDADADYDGEISNQASLAAVKSGGNYVLKNDIDLTSTVDIPAGVSIDFAGNKINGAINALGDLEIIGDAELTTLKAINGGKITVQEGKTLTLNNFSFGSSATAGNEYEISGGKITANYGFFQHGTYDLYSDFETGYMYYSYGSDITVYGTFHSKGTGDGLDYVRGKLTIANGGKSIHDKSLWVGQPESWGAMSASLTVEDGGYVQANSLSVYAGSALYVDAANLTVGEYSGVVANTISNQGEISLINNDELKAVVEGNKIVIKESSIRVTTAEELTNLLANITEPTTINATGVTLVPTGDATKVKIPAGVTLKGVTFKAEGTAYVSLVAGIDEAVVFENCVFQVPSFSQLVIGTNLGCSDVIFESCEFLGSMNFSYSDTPDTTGTYNNCTFGLYEGWGKTICMGGSHAFNTCSFDYTGGSSLNNSWPNAITAYGENRFPASVVLNGCTRTNCGTYVVGNATLR